jgi:hypothetical protein
MVFFVLVFQFYLLLCRNDSFAGVTIFCVYVPESQVTLHSFTDNKYIIIIIIIIIYFIHSCKELQLDMPIYKDFTCFSEML